MSEGNEAVTILAVGDISFRRDDIDQQFAKVRPLLQQGDITLGQMEGLLSNRGSGQLFTGLGASGRPATVPIDPMAQAKVLADDGFDAMNFAGNHTMDRSEDSMVDTIEAVRACGVEIFGAGRSITEAREPVIIDRNGTRVGFLGYCSVTPRGYEATPTRAGVAPLRVVTYYEQVDWQAGTSPRIITRTRAEDLAAMVEDIEKLRANVDVLVVSLHGGIHFEPATIAMYQYESSHVAVDAGADVVLWSHGAVLKGAEFYKNKPIFYCIGNFSLVPKGPNGEFLAPDIHFDSELTAIVKITAVGGKVERVALVPCWIDTRLEPEPIPAGDARSDQFIEYMRWTCTAASAPKNAWEAFYLRKAPEAKALASTQFTRDGDEVVLSA